MTEAMMIASLPPLLEDGSGGDAHRAVSMGPQQPQSYARLAERTILTQRRARELKDSRCLARWIDRESEGRSEATRTETPELNRLLCSWFSHIAIEVTESAVAIRANA
jgi:hypothetical protein